MLEKLLNKEKDKYGYISNFNEIIQFLRASNVSDDEINKILTHINNSNTKVYNNLYKDNEVFKRINLLVKSKTENNSKCEVTMKSDTCESINPEQTVEETIDISYYIDLINTMKPEDLEAGKLEQELPKTYNSDFEKIINVLILKFKRDLLEAKLLKKDTTESELIEYIENECSYINQIIDRLIKYRESFSTNNEIINTQEKIHILFDNQTFATDINNIDKSNYADFYVLLESLSRNILKGVKTFTPDGAKKISELRNNQARMLFEKVDDDTYLIYYIFLKKACDKYYHNTLISRANAFQNKKQTLTKELFESTESKERFLEQNEIICSSIMETLKPTNKIVKKKGEC